MGYKKIVNLPSFFLYLLPVCIVFSGNLSAVKVGPLNMLHMWVFIVFFTYLFTRKINIKYVIGFFAIFLLNFLIIFHQWYFGTVDSKAFYGAVEPLIYGALSWVRLIASLVAIHYLSSAIFPFHAIKRLLELIIIIFFIQIFVQFISSRLFGFDFGYFFLGNSINKIRYGGLFGEPHTILSWVFPATALIILESKKLQIKRVEFSIFILMALVVFYLSMSSAWLISAIIFLSALLFRSEKKIGILIVLVGVLIATLVYGSSLVEKIQAEYLVLSERSVTLVAGYEFFIKNPWLGYGLGMSPYLIPGSEVIQMHPIYDLSYLGRQNVMNSVLELIYELGIGGFAFILILFRKTVIRLFFKRGAILAIPVVVGNMSVGSGLVSAATVIYFSLILYFSRTDAVVRGMK